MPNVEVSCAVSDCFFHKQGNLCGAEKIQIDIDAHSKDRKTEFASDFAFDEISVQANNSRRTCCKTFEPKDEQKK